MIKAIIVDDEDHCINRLKTLLNDYCAVQVTVVATATDVDDAYDVIRLHKPDVVFLDVHIHNFTGFDLLQKFDRIDFDVVFATAFERYAIQAIKFSAADYLMKPIDPDDLVDAITKIQQKNKKDQTDFNLLFENVTNMKNHIRKIVVPTQDELLFLNIDDIIRCKSDINYTTIFLKNKTTVFVAKTLKDFESLLVPHNFYRVHNSHLINLDWVKSYSKGKGGYVQLEDNSTVEVSSRKRDGFLKQLGHLK